MTYSQELYQQVILDHNRKPRNFRQIGDATHICPGSNPLCGDKIVVYLKILDGVVADLSFEGSGCAISRASASMMTEAIKGKSLAEAKQKFDEFHRMLLGEMDPEVEANNLGKLSLFKGVRNFSSRVKCASLSWHTMMGAMDKRDTVSTE